MRAVDFTLTGSIGSRWGALLDDAAVPMPERLAALLDEIEARPEKVGGEQGSAASRPKEAKKS